MSAIQKLFKAFDVNGDNYVTTDEIKKCLSMLGAPDKMIAEATKDLMSRDEDKDGKLSEKEFTVKDFEIAGRSSEWLAKAITGTFEAEKKKKEFKEKVDQYKGSELFQFLLGDKLISKDGQVDTKSVVGDADYVAIYMSAHWCPPCRNFTPKFSEVHKKIAKDKKLATIFVSCDNSEKEFKEYFDTMPWHATVFQKDSDFCGFESRAGMHLDCQGIPQLSIFNREGKLISKMGVSLVHSKQEKFLDNLGIVV